MNLGPAGGEPTRRTRSRSPRPWPALQSVLRLLRRFSPAGPEPLQPVLTLGPNNCRSARRETRHLAQSLRPLLLRTPALLWRWWALFPQVSPARVWSHHYSTNGPVIPHPRPPSPRSN